MIENLDCAAGPPAPRVGGIIDLLRITIDGHDQLFSETERCRYEARGLGEETGSIRENVRAVGTGEIGLWQPAFFIFIGSVQQIDAQILPVLYGDEEARKMKRGLPRLAEIGRHRAAISSGGIEGHFDDELPILLRDQVDLIHRVAICVIQNNEKQERCSDEAC